jgi:hypothetical protein
MQVLRSTLPFSIATNPPVIEFEIRLILQKIESYLTDIRFPLFNE